jgi:hypothetical protein
MTSIRDFNTDPDKEYLEVLWDNFAGHYNFVGNGGTFINYPHEEFLIEGVPAPWQTIAWRRLIRLMGEDNFLSLPLKLNYLENPDVFFEKEFTKHFGSSANPEKLEVTFTCGFFWFFNENRRGKMLNFVVDNLLRKGTGVTIWTQDKALKEALDEKRREKLGNSARKKLHVYCVNERIDVHYTLVEDKENRKNSRIFMELPHTEAHDFRLETYLTFEKLESFGCNPKKFVRALNDYITCWYRLKLHPIRWFFSRCNLALNTERNKQ